MADEIVSVGIKIETTGADKAAASLDKVVSAGGKVDAAADKITAGAGKASKSLETLGATAATVAPQLDKAGSSGGKLGDLFKQATDGAGAFSGSLGLVKAGLVGAVTALSVQSVIELGKSFLRTADAITNLNSQLKLATGSAAAAKDAYEGLFAVAQRSRVGFVELGNTYAQIARATDGLGLSASSSLRIVETLGKAITISGVSAGSASAAMIQLSQGLSSGTLRGEELNSILEQTPRVARAIADGLGVSIGQLRTMGSEGKLTAEAVSGALLKASATIDKEFGSVATTVSQAMTVMGNATTKAVGDFDSIVGVSSAVATGILSIVDAAGRLKDMFSGSWTGQAVAALAAMRQKITDNRDNPTLDMLRVQLDNASRQATGDAGSGFGGEQRKASAQREVARLQERIRKLETEEWDKAAQLISEDADRMVLQYGKVIAAGNKFIEDKDNQTKAQQKESAFAKLRADFATATKDLKEGSAEYLRVYAAFLTGKDNIAKKFDDKEKVDRSGASKAKSDAEAYAYVIAQSEKRNALLAAEVEARRPLTALEKLSIELKEKEEELSRKNGTSRLAEVRALNEEAKSLVAAIELRKGFAEAKASELAAAVAVYAARKSTVDSLLDEAEAVEAQVKALRQETQAIGVTGVALALLTNKRVDDQIQALKNKATVADSGDEVEAIKRQIRALEALKEARIGNAQANVAADFAKESADAAKKSAEEWQKAYDQIGQGLTDSLFRAAEAGKGFFATLRDSIKGMFNNLVLKPIIQYVVQGGGGMALSALGMSGAAGAAGGVGGGIGSLSALGSIYNAGTSLLGIGAGSAAAYGALVPGVSMGSAQAAALAAQTGIFGAEGLAATASAAAGATGTGLAGSIVSAIGAIPVWGWGLMAAAAVAAIFGGDRGGPKGGGSFSTTGERLFTPDTADVLATKIGDGLKTSITGLLKDFGGDASKLDFGIGFDTDPQGTADNRIASFLRDKNGTSFFDNTGGRDIGRDEANISKEMQIETKRLMLAALQAVGPTLENGFGEIFARLDPATAAPEAIDNLFALAGQLKALGDAAERLPGVMGTIADISAVAREELIGLAGGLDSLTSGLQTYYREFFTAGEQLANAGANLATDFAKIGLSFDALQADSDGPRQAFRDLFEGLDLTTVGGRQSAAALLALAPALDSWIDSIDAAREAAREAASQSAASIDKAFLSDADYLSKTLTGLGLAVPRTAAEFEALVRAQDVTTESGRETVATLLGLKSSFESIEAASRAATNAVSVTGLEQSIAAGESELADLQAGISAVFKPAETAGQRLVRMAGELDSLSASLAAITNPGGTGGLAKLQSLIAAQDQLQSARAGIGSAIDEQTLQGFQARGDTAGAVAFLQALEGRLWAGLAGAADKGAAAGRIQSVFLQRIGLEAGAAQKSAEEAARVAVADAQKVIDLERASREQRIKGLEDEIRAAEQFAGIAESLRRTVADLKFSDLSPLNPQDQLNAAKAEFERVLGLAQGGDLTALQSVGGVGTSLIQEQRSFGASTSATADVFNQVTGALDALGVGLGTGDVTDAQRQLDELRAIKDPIVTLTAATVDYSGEAIEGLRAIDTALAAGTDYLGVAITTAIADLQAEVVRLTAANRDDAEAARLQVVAMGAELVRMRAELTAIKDNTGGTRSAVQASAAAPKVVA